MGQCIGKGSDDPFNDIHPHIFSVLNIDENGRYVHSIPLQYTMMHFALSSNNLNFISSLLIVIVVKLKAELK